MNKKYLLFIDSLGSGGAQNQVVQIAKGLIAKDKEVLVVYYHELFFFAPYLDESKIEHILMNKSSGLLSLIKGIKNLIKEKEITHLISFLEGPNFYATLVKIIFPLCKFTLIVSERSRTPLLSKLSKRFIIKKMYLLISSKIMTNSHHEKDNLISQFKINKKKIFVIYNIVDLEKFKPRVVEKRFNTILCIGSISEMKNGLLIIKAINDYNKSEKTPLNVDWFGEHALHIKERKIYSEQMLKLIKESNLESYWNWFKPTHAINELYSEYQCLVLASTTEGLPNVVCEALSSGIPVIISNILDHDKLVNKDRGYLFNPLDEKSLKNKLVDFYQLSENDIKRLSVNARVYAEHNFSSEKNIIKLIQSC